MKGIALLTIGVTGALMLDREDSRSQQLGAMFVHGSVFDLLDLRGGA